MCSSSASVVLLCQIRMPFVLSLSKDERIRPSGSRFDRLSTNGNAGIHESDKVGVVTTPSRNRNTTTEILLIEHSFRGSGNSSHFGARTTRPSFITKCTLRNAWARSSGFSGVAMMSAARPGAIAPRRVRRGAESRRAKGRLRIAVCHRACQPPVTWRDGAPDDRRRLGVRTCLDCRPGRGTPSGTRQRPLLAPTMVGLPRGPGQPAAQTPCGNGLVCSLHRRRRRSGGRGTCEGEECGSDRAARARPAGRGRPWR